MNPLELEIGELVLHGLDGAQADAFVAALRLELARALAPSAARAALQARGDLDLPGPSRPLMLSTTDDSAAAGRATGRAVIREVMP